MKRILLITLISTAFSINAATIAVIDSGVDVEHVDLVNNIWTNPGEVANNHRDDDGNSYPDDFYGWNFAEQNNLVIDRSYIGTFSTDPYKFFELQGKAFMGTITQEERDWITSKRGDKDFIKEMGKFGNFVHGTHVAGITAKGTTSKILAVKLIPTEVKLIADQFIQNKGLFVSTDDGWRMKTLKKLLSGLASQQMLLLKEIAIYINDHKADVANGSFGTGFEQAKMITENLYKVVFFKKPDEAASNEVTLYFMNELIKFGSDMVAAAPNTLFVFAAGNSASDNDAFPTSPANVKADNVITVAATYKNSYLAPFSCFGKTKVDIAAPGMLIHSQIPGNEYLKVSGTSQAAPFVANVASLIKDANVKLTPKEMKQILLGTVDKKSYLEGKVSSTGLINMDRAVYAANKSASMSVADAISDSIVNVQDGQKSIEFKMTNADAIIPIQLPSLFR